MLDLVISRASEYPSLEYSRTRVFDVLNIETSFQILDYCNTIERLEYSKARLKSLKMYIGVLVYSSL